MKKKVALVLGSGGARGTAHIGVIREILNQGYEISAISGTSMGAMVGGIYACGKLDEYEQWLDGLDKKTVFSLVDIAIGKNGMMKADRFIKELQKFIPDVNIEDLPIPFSAIATDLNHKEEKVIETGSLWEAIRASISIPFVMTPAKIDSYDFVDGGVMNPVPTNRVKRVEGDILVAANVNSRIPINSSQIIEKNETVLGNARVTAFKEKLAPYLSVLDKKRRSYLQIGTEASVLMIAQIAKLTMQLYPPDVIIKVSRDSCGTFDFHRAKELILMGKLATIEGLANYNKES